MTPRIPSQLLPPITFAHRGARSQAPENTLEAFGLALDLGASGLESDVWITRDGAAVLVHDGVTRQGLRRRALRDLDRSRLPASVPTLEELYAAHGTSMELSLDVKDPAAFTTVVAVARAAGEEALSRLWLCHPDWQQVAEWRQELKGPEAVVHLVDSTRLGRIKEGPERRAASLANAGIDAVNMHHSDWTGGLTTVFHRFGVLTFGWDAQLPRVLDELFDLGIDAVYSDHVDRMVAAFHRVYG